MALASVRNASFSYGEGERAALADVSLALEPGEIVLVLGPSGSGKTTLVRALAGLVPHFHGGRFSGSVEVAGRDTRQTRPAELAGTVGTLFQDPEDQIVFGGVEAEVAFGIENAGAPPEEIADRVAAALASVGAGQLAGRRVSELSGGELQRVCLASTLALEPALLLLDEPTAQLDHAAAVALIELVERLARGRGTAVVLSEQRSALALGVCDRVLFVEGGALLCDAPRDRALDWLETNRPTYVQPLGYSPRAAGAGDVVCALEGIAHAYADGPSVLENATLTLRAGETVGLVGPNGSGKTTLAKIASGLLEPNEGRVVRAGRATYLSQDPGRYLACERCDEEVALGASSRAAAERAFEAVGLRDYEGRHPRDLSSGERERLALAAVLATEPDLLVLDEPTRGLDPDARRRLVDVLASSAHTRATLLVTHDDELVSALADRAVALGDEGARLAA